MFGRSVTLNANNHRTVRSDPLNELPQRTTVHDNDEQTANLCEPT
jgi:hypothetical protein